METLFGKRLKDLRKNRGLTQVQLAIQVGTSSQVISNIERNYSSASRDVINKLADYFNVSTDYLIGSSSIVNPDIIYRPERIWKRMCDLQINEQEMASRCEISADSMEDILSGTKELSIYNLIRIANVLETTILFLTGKTDFWAAIENEDEQDIIEFYRNLDKRKRRIFMGELEVLSEGRNLSAGVQVQNLGR